VIDYREGRSSRRFCEREGEWSSIDRWVYTEAVVLVLKEGGLSLLPPARIAGREREDRWSANMRIEPSGTCSQNSRNAGRGDDTTRVADVVRAPGLRPKAGKDIARPCQGFMGCRPVGREGKSRSTASPGFLA